MGWEDKFEWSDIAAMIQAACEVIVSIETVDFGLIENGKSVKRELTSSAVDTIRKGLGAFLKED
jgi:hypothetical protein